MRTTRSDPIQPYDGPCELPCRCEFYYRCRDEKMACRDFQDFIQTGKIVKRYREPSGVQYRQIFRVSSGVSMPYRSDVFRRCG
jgi:hypothetical protein